ncbi:MAG TPA: tetratricopeptide repeat protein [Steroidobacteraceae bacterium]|nr:tetratricopeptide repeat protein [Steroidobacteraceae bacterium]
MRTRSVLLAVALAAALAVAAPAGARRHDPEKLPETRIHDLHYGDVLFYYFQNQPATDFEALTRLLAYEHWNRMPHHADEAALLKGGLYLELGMHNEAGRLFAQLLTNDVPSGVRNRAWFYLAQVWYERGYLDRAADALQRINGRMFPDLEGRRELLVGNVLIHQGRLDEAIRVLEAWRGTDPWSQYARFNLGVALARDNRLNEAAPLLTQVGTMQARTEEQLALRDRANLALGFASLQANDPTGARPALERVRLNGPYSNKALLGTGWADAALGDYQRALNPWMELRSRDVLDAAVQESYLAVPYAFSKLNANAQSVQYYESAVQSFDAENARLDAAIARVRAGGMLDQVLARDRAASAPSAWLQQLRDVPDAPESRYLYTVLAGYDFQDGLNNYRDLKYLGGLLGRWDESMDAFQDMIGTRERAYAERLPRVDALLASNAVGQLQQRDVDLTGRLHIIESQHDVAALGADEERDQWARIQRLEAALAGAPDTPDNADLRERLALVKGVLYYRLNDAFNARLWQEHRSLRDLDLALREAQSRWIHVEQARKSTPQNTGEFAERAAALKTRIEALQTRLAALEDKQREYLAQIAVRELRDEQSRLAAYQVQARFALATIYDRAAGAAGAANGPVGKTAPGTAPAPAAQPAPPVQPAPETPR